MRKEMPKNKDEKVFRHTADKTKKVNIGANIYRGGFRF